MARIAKYVLGAAATAVIALGAVAVAQRAGLLAGSLVVLAALIATTLISRTVAAREERTAMADWDEVLERDAPADAFFSDWTATMPRTGPITPARPDDLELTAHTAAGLESLDDLASPAEDDEVATVEAPVLDLADPVEPAELVDEPAGVEAEDTRPADHDDVVPLGLAATAMPPMPDAPESPAPTGDHGPSFPFDDPFDGFGELGDLPPFGGEADDAPPFGGIPPQPEPVALARDPEPISPAWEPEPIFPAPEPAAPVAEMPLTSPAVDLDGPPPGGFEVPDLAPIEADAFSFAGAVSTPNQSRRTLIDWSGPVRTVDEQVRSADDILEASNATALPTASDRPAPAGGSELARLLAKVEERLREYD